MYYDNKINYMAQKQQTAAQIADLPKLVIRRQFTPGGHIPDTETNTEPSQTIPGQAMTPAQMLDRVSKGLPINNNAQPVYNGERLLPNWKNLDLIDRQIVVEQAHEQVKRLREQKKKDELRYQASIQANKLAAEEARKKKEEAAKNGA